MRKSGNSTGSTQSDSEAEALEADFEAAMQDDNVKLSEAGIESMNLISTNDYDIDAEYAAEVSFWRCDSNKCAVWWWSICDFLWRNYSVILLSQN